MIQINKNKQANSDTTKLIVKAAKDSLITPKLAPKELKSNKQAITPKEETNADSMFIIY